MREELTRELDLLFKQKNNNGVERRLDPRLKDFESYLQVLTAFARVREQIIRPVMEQFGSYLQSLGHRYFIETAQELVEGHVHPSSRIVFHILLNANMAKTPLSHPALYFRMDEARNVFAVKKTSQGISPVERYQMESLKAEQVEQQIKQFIIETVL